MEKHQYAQPLFAWVQQHPLTAFVILAFAFSWTAWGLTPFVARFELWFLVGEEIIGTFGPSLAALIVTGVCNNMKWRDGFAWVGVYVLSLILCGLLAWWGVDRHSFRYTIGYLVNRAVLIGLCVSLPAAIIASVFSIRSGTNTHPLFLKAWRVSLAWYGMALMLWFILAWIGVRLDCLAGRDVARVTPMADWVRPSHLLHLPMLFVTTLLWNGPLGEEVGWRGFALPRLQLHYSPLVASLILSIIWTLWHAPLHFGIYGNGLRELLIRLVFFVPFTIIYTWFYNRTGGSVLIAILLHTSFNMKNDFVVVNWVSELIPTLLLALGVVLIDRMWCKRLEVQVQC